MRPDEECDCKANTEDCESNMVGVTSSSVYLMVVPEPWVTKGAPLGKVVHVSAGQKKETEHETSEESTE